MGMASFSSSFVPRWAGADGGGAGVAAAGTGAVAGVGAV
jgi:hypothetical protein